MIKKIVLGVLTSSVLCLNAVALETDNAFMLDDSFSIKYPKEMKTENCSTKKSNFKNNMPVIGLDTEREENTVNQTYCSKNAYFSLTAVGNFKTKKTLKGLLSSAIKSYSNMGGDVTFKKQKSNYVLMSGFIGFDYIFYQGIKEVSPNQFVGFSIQYPKSEKKKYDSYLNSVVNDFVGK